MVKTIQIIILSTFLGCSDSNFMLEPVYEDTGTTSEKFSQVFYFDENPRLDQDENGYYHLDIDMNNWQTLHRLSGSISDSASNQPVVSCRVEWRSSHYWTLGDTLGFWVREGLNDELEWVSYDTSYVVGFDGMEIPTINPVSYSNSDGEVNTMIAPVQNMVRDTMTIWYSWGGWYTSWETNSIRIVLD